MQEKTFIANSIEMAAHKAKYDAEVKKILSDKHILAWILKGTAGEFQDASIDRIIDCIESDPQISEVPVYPGKTNLSPEAITGLSTEDKVPNEGEVTYDIRFFAFTPNGEKIKLIINVEAQKKYHVGYDLVTRAVFYCARMLSAQKDTEFIGENFNDIKKVYSIWICMDSSKAAANTITEYKITKNMLYGADLITNRYDLMSAVMVYLGDEDKEGTPLHKMLSILLSNTRKPNEKEAILNRDYDIPMSRERMVTMCNLSDIIEEKGIEKGIEQGIEQGIEKGIEKGESRMAALINILISKNRIDDLSKMTNDTEYRSRLFKEFGL